MTNVLVHFVARDLKKGDIGLTFMVLFVFDSGKCNFSSGVN